MYRSCLCRRSTAKYTYPWLCFTAGVVKDPSICPAKPTPASCMTWRTSLLLVVRQARILQQFAALPCKLALCRSPACIGGARSGEAWGRVLLRDVLSLLDSFVVKIGPRWFHPLRRLSLAVNPEARKGLAFFHACRPSCMSCWGVSASGAKGCAAVLHNPTYPDHS